MQLDYRETLAQLGGPGIQGALAYTGTSAFSVSDNMAFLKVNGKPGYKSFISITLEPGDYYTVRYHTKRGTTMKIHEKMEEIYCEDLQDAVEAIYDMTMNKTNHGFIPLGR